MGCTATVSVLLLNVTRIIDAKPAFILKAVRHLHDINIGATVVDLRPPPRFASVEVCRFLTRLLVISAYALELLGAGAAVMSRRET